MIVQCPWHTRATAAGLEITASDEEEQESFPGRCPKRHSSTTIVDVDDDESMASVSHRGGGGSGTSGAPKRTPGLSSLFMGLFWSSWHSNSCCCSV